ncbi:hypothetical protein HYH03_017901 [Edaphochlamys debaryana]|uniref:phytol kinase n=1 Tax=Edaphochlamys debaryana TaxID=47281 RepID=A0A835XNB4_9CHLO|nr:hypothetical protein HYH03_017901 [Edaphochlamys debaryana]|eukprot:KAG2483244.1 hypothetical protein HYH03_017901 [Edaphochlamys debaryana]
MLRACLIVSEQLLSMTATSPPSTSPEPTRPALAVLDFARRLLRAETLQALAARLAEVRQAVSGGDAGQFEPTVFSAYCWLTHAVVSLLGACLTWVIISSSQPQTTAAAAAAEECYRSELAAALRSSYISEHIAATTLALLRDFEGSHGQSLLPKLAGDRTQLLHELAVTAAALLQLAVEQAAASAASPPPADPAPSAQPNPPLAAVRHAAALGPCASYLTLAYGMSVLSYMDGGGTRGLPEDVARVLGEELRAEARARLQQLASREEQISFPPVDSEIRDSGQGSVACSARRLKAGASALVAVRNLQQALLAAAFAVRAASPAARAGFPPSAAATAAATAAFAAAAPSTATPLAATLPSTPSRRLQLGWHTALGLAMRAARMCVRAAEEAAAGRTRKQEAAALTAALEGRGTFRALLGRELAAAGAVGALAVTAQLRSLLPAASGADASANALVDQGAEWWRLLASVAPHLCLMQMTEPLPPVAPPALASALAGRVLPCLERLIRRAAAAARGAGHLPDYSTPELLALKSFEDAGESLVDSMTVTWGWFAPLLAYGDPREVGVLVATLGKALAGCGSINSHFDSLLVDTVSGACMVGHTWLDDITERLEHGGALTPPERQLARMLGAAAAAWLPEVSHSVSSAMTTVPLSCVLTGLLWLPLLSCAAALTAGVAAAAAASSGRGTPAVNVAATNSGGGGAGGGWRSFAEALFPAAEFISKALNLQSPANSDDGSRQALAPWTAKAACTFAALRPQEAAAGVGSWLRTEQVRALASELKAGGQAEEADALEALAAQLVRWERGGGARGGGRSGGSVGGRAAAAASGPPLAARYGVWVPLLQSAAALLPASPAAARQLLGGCSNPACANLEGDSDAALPLRACAGCGGAASYCSRECQTAHWRSGHREACGGGAGGGGRGGGG